MSAAPRERRLTGGMVLAILIGAFGVIIAVNILLAWQAVRTFSGLAVENSYISSQTFDRDRKAQEALGWTLTIARQDDALRIEIVDKAGNVVRPASIAVVVGRPSTMQQDMPLTLVETPAGWVADAPLAPGIWSVRVNAKSADGVAYYRREPLFLPPQK